MLIDPFLSTEPPYSERCSGVREISDEDPSPIKWLGAIKGCFELAGWTQTGNVPSEGDQQISKSHMWFTTPPIPPVVPALIDDPCGPSTSGGLGRMTTGDLTTWFMPYDPYRYLAPTEPCNGKVWFPVGLTNQETADNLAEAMTDNSPFLVTVSDNPANANEFNFHYTSAAPAWEYDETVPWVGWGEHYVDGGYYTYRSQSLNGCTLTVRLQNNTTGCFRPGGVYWLEKPAIIGALQPWLMIKSSGSPFDEWQSVFWTPTHCFFHGGPFQFAIWTDQKDRFHSSILVSMLQMDIPHFTGANPILIVSSENLDMQMDYQQLMEKLHWQDSIGTGFNNQLHYTTWPNRSTSGPNPDGKFRTPMVMFRGLRNVPLYTLSDTALAQPAYVILSEDPTGQPRGDQQDFIGGRLWDMAIVTDTTLNLDSKTMMSGRKWTQMSTSTRPTDLLGSLWVTHDPVGQEETDAGV